MNNTSSVPTEHALTPYGGRADVQSLAKRIMAMHPAAKQIGDRGALLLAQLGIALGLNPLPGTGHIHAWLDGSTLCVHIGIEGRMALARKDSPFSHSERPMSPDEVELHNIKPGDRGSICELYRHDHTQMFAKLGLPVKPVIGIGIATANERPPKGRTLYWRASQRAIKDALRLAYSFSLPGEVVNDINLRDDAPENVMDAEFTSGEVEPATARTESEREQRESDSAALFGTDEETSTPVSQTEKPVETVIPRSEPVAVNPVTTAPVASEQASGSSPKRKPARVATRAWFEAIKPIAKLFPKYLGKDGNPNSSHLQMAAASEGYTEITDANLALVIQALNDRAHQDAQDERAQAEMVTS